jgi:hypothetical protein
MVKFQFLLVIIAELLASGCTDYDHLISDRSYRKTVEAVFAERQQLASARNEQLFSLINKKLSTRQTEALKFLFAFMPLSDLADYNGEFFLENVNVALDTRKDSPWGNNIPEDIFLHYVLPCRVNNENLDSFRLVYHNEISERIKGMDMEMAALEVNHWCHEKVTYQPSDIRTSGPMSTILSARGRCGEESTFTVSALRTAGIPARQVYTPRWAHSDDNHAWVEIWANGIWHYMGACEPEPVLDLGWFTEPARRAMLVHTKSFGAWYGNENGLNKQKYFSEINNLSKYAVTKRIYVRVVDENRQPVKDASVEYQLYNYAEFFPLALVPTDENGISSFETGLGDLLIWARKDNSFNYRKISVPEIDTLSLILDRTSQGIRSEDIDLSVPPVVPASEGPAKELVEKNAERIRHENTIRQAYVDTWIKPEDAESFARQIDTDPIQTAEIIAKSMGNYKEIMSFLRNTHEKDRGMALSLLNSIAEKDLRDTRTSVLTDHLDNIRNPLNLDVRDRLFIDYVLNPRVSDEMLVPFRKYFGNVLPAELITGSPKDPGLIINFINKSVLIANDENFYKTPLTPVGVNELKVADTKSRAIYFVALCRSMGIPSRLEPGSKNPQYLFNSEWIDVYFSDEKAPAEAKGYLNLFTSETNPVPEYYIHFTLARFENGRYKTLEYDYNKRITDFPEELTLSAGHYMIVTGNRLNDRKILSNISFFDLAQDQHLSKEIKLRRAITPAEISGKIDLTKLNAILANNKNSNPKSFEKGVVLACLEPEREPSKHFLNDLLQLKSEFDLWGGPFVFIVNDPQKGRQAFNLSDYKGLPANSISVVDNKMKILQEIWFSYDQSEIAYPVIILADKNGNILYKSTGYSIGTGGQILKIIPH